MSGRWSDPGFKQLYLSAISKLAEITCAPLWWSVARPGDTAARILHNGTICYVATGSRRIGVTANHVYQAYLEDLRREGADAIECQFGSSTIYPERHAIVQSALWDVATFDVPEVFVGASQRNPKSHHHAVQWPPRRPEQNDIVLYGGFPGTLREEKGHIADLPFQWVAGRVTDVSDQNIVLEPDFETMQWQNDNDTNDDPGGWSGGPVFRSVEDGPIARLELVGFIYEFPLRRAVLARHADVVSADGALR